MAKCGDEDNVTKFLIGHLWVHFPFVPYGPQEDFMNKMIESLESGQNALLESPTGTGKTLCLLCASLAWLDSKRKQEEIPDLRHLERLNSSNDSEVETDSDTEKIENDRENVRRYRIYFCSRTHSQIKQVIKEFQNCTYGHLRSTVLGSRRHLCINPCANQLKDVDSKCKVLRSNTKCVKPGPSIEELPKKCSDCLEDHKCPYYKNFEEMKKEGMAPFALSGAFDQNKLINKCKEYKVCPFYVSRHLQGNADIVFLPYTYIFNPHICSALQLNLKNAIIIIDEGHNLERVCEENASFEMKISDATNCLDELNNTLKFFEAVHEYADFPHDVRQNDVFQLMDVIRKLEGILRTEIKAGHDYSGRDCWKFVVDAGFNHEADRLLYNLKELYTYSSLKKEKSDAMKKIYYVVKTITTYGDSCVLQESFVLYKEKLELQDKQNLKEPKEPKIHLWCFDASVIMKSLWQKGVHSFIVTSGTLAPLPVLKRSLGIPFGVELVNKHVVDRSQILGLCVSEVRNGSSSVTLNASYQNRLSHGDQFYFALGKLVLEVAEATPKGLLIFFPSGTVKNDCLSLWYNTSVVHKGKRMTLFDALSDMKPVYEEPKEAKDLPRLQNIYSDSVHDPKTEGACLIGVLSGKVSEGIDFKDDLGRAVIMVGLPYPPYKDEWVKHKKKYLECKIGSSAEWYLSQAIRPINQALGRIIRHQKDYGSVILADTRYQKPPNTQNNYKVLKALPEWLEKGLQHIRFDNVQSCLRDFFSTIPEKIRENEKETKKVQDAICQKHSSLWKEQYFPAETYHGLLAKTTEELTRRETLNSQINDLRQQQTEKWNRIVSLKLQLQQRKCKMEEMSVNMIGSKEKHFDSDCESDGESEWDKAVPAALIQQPVTPKKLAETPRKVTVSPQMSVFPSSSVFSPKKPM